MQLAKHPETIAALVSRDPFFERDTVQCWKKTEQKVNIHAFSFLFQTPEALFDAYAEIRDRIAIFFQGELVESAADRWNIYIFYFVNGRMDPVKKQVIEQDKFSARKYVIDAVDIAELPGGNYNEDIIGGAINRELFDLEIPARLATQGSLDQLLQAEHKNVHDLLEQFGDRADIEQILNVFNHD